MWTVMHGKPEPIREHRLIMREKSIVTGTGLRRTRQEEDSGT